MAEDELWKTLIRFHREIIRPDIEQIVDERVTPQLKSLRNEMLTHYDGLWKRFDTLESEYVSLNAALHRVEDRLSAVEGRLTGVEDRLSAVEGRLTGVESRLSAVEEKLDKMALRTELIDLKERLGHLQRRIDELEKHVL